MPKTSERQLAQIKAWNKSHKAERAAINARYYAKSYKTQCGPLKLFRMECRKQAFAVIGYHSSLRDLAKKEVLARAAAARAEASRGSPTIKPRGATKD